MAKLIVILVGVVLLVGGGILGWQMYTRTAVSQEEGVTDPATEALVRDIRRIKDIHLDVSLFSDPLFRQLRAPRLSLPTFGASTTTTGTSTSILPVPNKGRTNPFAPF